MPTFQESLPIATNLIREFGWVERTDVEVHVQSASVSITIYYYGDKCAQRMADDAAIIRRVLQVETKKNYFDMSLIAGFTMTHSKTIGDVRIYVSLQTNRDKVCRKIETGNMVPVKKYVETDEMEPEYKWECDPVLGD